MWTKGTRQHWQEGEESRGGEGRGLAGLPQRDRDVPEADFSAATDKRRLKTEN